MVTDEQLRADLRNLVRGELHIDPVQRALYATDASPFSITPLAVAVPRDETDVQAIVRYAGDHGLSVVPRGAGTGLAGESLGDGIILDLSVHFREPPVLQSDCVRISPGTTLAELNTVLAKSGRRFAPNLANAASATLGGMIATNASGANAAVHGYVRDHVESLRVVWDTGEIEEISRRSPAEGSRSFDLIRGVRDLLRDNLATVLAHLPKTPFNRFGYHLHDILTPQRLDLVRLVVGSEGTLGIVTAATLNTIPLPGGTAFAVLALSSQDDAARVGAAIRTTPGVVGCDLLDRRLIALAGLNEGLGTLPPTVEACLIVSTEGETEREALEQLREAIRAAEPVARLAVLAEPTCEPTGTARIVAFRSEAVGRLYALGSGPRPLAVVEDIGVPPDAVPEFLGQLQSILRSHDVTASVLVHCPTGVVHTRPLIDLQAPADREKLWPLADALYAAALELGGTVSAQHGAGLSRTPWVRKQYGDAAELFREVKRIFDPKGIFNPGKIVGPDPTRPAWPLRHLAGRGRTPLLSWRESPEREAATCNGCGDCRPRDGSLRMCPLFAGKGSEAATPRAKANLSLLLSEAGVPDPDAVAAVADLCVNCKMCREECKAGVDVPKLMIEAKAKLWQERGTDRVGWFLARAESLINPVSYFPFTANLMLGTRPGRWLLERFFGLSRSIRLPTFRYRSFLWRAWRRGWTRRPKHAEGDKFVYYVDPLMNATDPLLGEAAVAVLQFHGASVVVSPSIRSTGMAALTAGDVETARDYARRVVRMLADFARDGYRIVCTDPTAAVAFTQEYPNLLTDDDTKLVAERTVEFTALLWEWHEQGRLKSTFQHVNAYLGHHVPCHVKALRGPAAGPKLLSLIPGVQVTTIDTGCSGMAGPWGLAQRNRAASLAAGDGMIRRLDTPGVIFGSTECGACRIQMQETSGKRTMHPAQFLALAYGLLPEVEYRLFQPLKPRLSR